MLIFFIIIRIPPYDNLNSICIISNCLRYFSWYMLNCLKKLYIYRHTYNALNNGKGRFY